MLSCLGSTHSPDPGPERCSRLPIQLSKLSSTQSCDTRRWRRLETDVIHCRLGCDTPRPDGGDGGGGGRGTPPWGPTRFPNISINYCHIYRRAALIPPLSNGAVGAAQSLPVSRSPLSWRNKTKVVAKGGGGHPGADLPTAVSVVGTHAPSPCCVTLQPPSGFQQRPRGPWAAPNRGRGD